MSPLPLSIPAIPEGISDQGLIAVLFLIILGWVAVMYALRQLPKAFAPLVEAIDRWVASNVNIGNRLTELEKSVEGLKEHAQEIRTHIHARLTPAIAGLTIAYLRRAGYDDLADQLREENPDAVIPPEGKRRRGDSQK